MIAVKKVKDAYANNKMIRERARQEASLAFRHPNLVEMVGYCEYAPNTGPIFILSHFGQGEDIDKYAKSFESSPMRFEKICNATFTGKGITEVLCYLYATILASDRDNPLTFDEYMDWIDENPDVISQFSEWLQKVVDKNGYIAQHAEKANAEENPKNV